MSQKTTGDFIALIVVVVCFFPIDKCLLSAISLSTSFVVVVANFKHFSKYAMANEEPLVLHDCGYSNLNMQYTPLNLWAVSACLEEQFNTVAVKLAQLKNAIDDLNALKVRRCDVMEVKQRRLNGSNNNKDVEAPIGELSEDLHRDKRSKLDMLENSKSNDASSGDLGARDFMIWKDALHYLGGIEAAPGVRRHHVPLMQREGAKVLGRHTPLFGYIL
jgi:hypothetical protein